MKIYIALFTTLIAAGHFTNVSAADATASVDGASHPHLRALADARRVACGNGYCNNNNQCGRDEVCMNGGGGCSGKCAAVISVSSCPESTCDSNGDGCPSGSTCDTGDGSTTGCHGCRADNQSTPLRASILKEE